MREVWTYVFVWVEGAITRVVPYRDVAKARAVAERLAEPRGSAPSP